MIRRPLELCALTLLGGVLALQWSDTRWGVLAGSLAGSFAWVVSDNLRAARLLAWLRHGTSTRAPRLPDVWSELVERIRKSHKQLNRKARKSEVRLQEFLSALQASPNGVVLLDRGLTIAWANSTASQHLGIDPQRDLGQQVRNLIRHPDFIAFLNATDRSRSIEIDGRDAYPGHQQRIAIHLHPYGKGRLLMLTRDVTALQLAEAMRRDFVANVSHEIRTPLTVLSGFVETLQTLPLNPDEQTRYLALMAQQAQRMQTLVSDLLTLSRLEGSPVPGASEWVSVPGLLEEAVAEARALSDVLAKGAHQIELQTGETLDVAGSREELHSAVSNLLSNAVRYTPAGGRIAAGWRVMADGSMELFVSDTGPGIAAEHLTRLTERFYRVDRSRSRETGGTGLGLAIVKHVVQRHGGQVQMHSILGQGSTFGFTLPASRVLLH